MSGAFPGEIDATGLSQGLSRPCLQLVQPKSVRGLRRLSPRRGPAAGWTDEPSSPSARILAGSGPMNARLSSTPWFAATLPASGASLDCRVIPIPRRRAPPTIAVPVPCSCGSPSNNPSSAITPWSLTAGRPREPVPRASCCPWLRARPPRHPPASSLLVASSGPEFRRRWPGRVLPVACPHGPDGRRPPRGIRGTPETP